MFKNRKLFKTFISDVKNNNLSMNDVSEKLSEFPIKVVRKIGREIIFSDYDGYNDSNISGTLSYFDNLTRSQKEFFIEQMLYKLY